MKYILVVLMFAFSCSSLDNVKNSRWKYSEGYHIGDLLNFNHTQQFRIDDKGNLYVKDELKGKVLKHTKSKLVIESATGKQGTYIFFDKRLD